MMTPLSPIGETRLVHFFENTNEAMPSQESPETKQEKAEKTGEKSDKATDKAMEKMMERIARGDSSRTREMSTMQSTDAFQKKIDTQNSIGGDVDTAVATASKDAADIVEESTDIGGTMNLDDISNEIGRKPAPNEVPNTASTETEMETSPTKERTDAGVQREADAAEKAKASGAPPENAEVSRSR